MLLAITWAAVAKLPSRVALTRKATDALPPLANAPALKVIEPDDALTDGETESTKNRLPALTPVVACGPAFDTTSVTIMGCPMVVIRLLTRIASDRSAVSAQITRGSLAALATAELLATTRIR